MSLSTIIHILFVIVASFSVEACKLSVSFQLPGVFLQEYGSNKLLLDTQKGFIEIAEGATIQGICNSGFRNLFQNQSPNNKFDNITFTCQNGEIYYLSTTTLVPVNSEVPVVCYNEQAALYMGPIPQCASLGLFYGVTINNEQIVLAEVCYNVLMSNIEYLHFVAGQRSNILEKQNDLSPQKIAFELSPPLLFSISETNAKEIDRSLQDATKSELRFFKNVATYDAKNLLPLETYMGRLKSLTQSFDSVNLVPFWSNFHSENWKSFLEIVENLSENGLYDIYAGTSGIVQYPVDRGCNQIRNFTFKTTVSDNQPVPFYIWNYVVPRNIKQPATVVVGINSPFLDVTTNKRAIFCTDICDNINWLNPLKSTRRMSSLGYIFCCSSDEAAKYLKGFPKIKP